MDTVQVVTAVLPVRVGEAASAPVLVTVADAPSKSVEAPTVCLSSAPAATAHFVGKICVKVRVENCTVN